MVRFIRYALIVTLFFSCEEEKFHNPLFELKTNTGIDFNNVLIETEQLNPYTYKNFYNGGGVALGDINNDGLLDIYFTGNLVENKLYLNTGHWRFDDITKEANVASTDVWSSGVTFVDINADGFLDIYVCKAGPPSQLINRHNELFINNGDLTFTEQSKDYGLDITGLSVQANFFDYDKDGDLDCYLLNNSIKAVGNFDYIKDQRNTPTSNGNRLLENVNNKFVDVTEKANIYSSAIGFGLGITTSDYNNDSWPDLFISNDFFERDYLYINNQDGTFKEELTNQFKSISMGSMGADAADLNNDTHTDIMVTEMLPKTIERQRTKTVFESWNKYDKQVKSGYHYQFSRNALHRNMGNNCFFEISRFSNVAASEWSWSTLLFDADNDGFKDIFISNGIGRDLLDRDYLSYSASESQIKKMIDSEEEIIVKLINKMPSKPVVNEMYKNLGDFRFKDKASDWGFTVPSFSNGSTYGDLDNDGDLDLVVNNVNLPSFIYKNNTDSTKQKSITIKLVGSSNNTKAIGAKAKIYYNSGKYAMLENFPSRGFQSSVSNNLLFGVNTANTVDSLIITWPDSKVSKYFNLKTNKTYSFYQNSAVDFIQPKTQITAQNIKFERVDNLFNFVHKENKAVDFNHEQLLPEMYNNEGPHITSADVNNDGLPDFYIGGAKGQTGKLFLSQNDNFYKEIEKPFHASYTSEDTEAVFFDSDNDGDLDLYVSSGGKSFSKYDFSLHDRLYINDGNANFSIKSNAFQFKAPMATGAVSVYDFDNDNDLDIFIGERFKTETYGLLCNGYILENLGGNNFKVLSPKVLQNIGLITDATWEDLNNDGTKDLIIVGEWMPISIFINNNGQFENKTKEFGFSNSIGFWKKLKVIDLDDDGDLDFIVGNKGSNTFFKKGTKIYISDFDSNGKIEQIFCHKKNGKYYPILDRDELISQIASLKNTFLFYKDYANADIETIFSKSQLSKAIVREINSIETTVFINQNNTFKSQKIPPEIQYSNVEAIEVFDINDDGILDILFGGNQYLIKPQFGIQDASSGWLILGNKNKTITKPISLNIKGQIRGFSFNSFKDKTYLLSTINNDSIQFHEVK